MTDADLDSCWRKSLRFHAAELAAQAQVFASAILHVNHWRNANPGLPETFAVHPSHSFNRAAAVNITGNASAAEEAVTMLEELIINEVATQFDAIGSQFALSSDRIRDLLLLVLNNVSTAAF